VRLSPFASVKLTIILMTLIALSVLVGAWCPQEPQVGFQRVEEVFGTGMAASLRRLGITDLFHTPFFLGLIGMITLNMVACSVQRVFPKARLLKKQMVFLSEHEIGRFPNSLDVRLNCPAVEALESLGSELKKQGFLVEIKDGKLKAERAKLAILASTVTHIGLLSLLVGVTITSWTGFSGFKPVAPGGFLNFDNSEHSKLWIGSPPRWKVRVESTHREDYENGEAKQWYSKLSVIGTNGKVLKQQEISVNTPLSFDGVDVYQSSWGLDSIEISVNGHTLHLPLRQMGNANVALMQLDKQTTLIFSLRGQDKPLRIFAKIPGWQQPRMLTEVPQGGKARIGEAALGYIKPMPVTGLQYKADPGLPITYAAFAIITLGVVMAAIPYRQVWGQAIDGSSGVSRLHIAGISKKSRTTFQRNLEKILARLKARFGEPAAGELEARPADNT